MDLKALASNLRSFRKAFGYTQEDLGELLNIQRQSYCNYETGRRVPNIEILIDLADIYQVPLDTLVNPPAKRMDSSSAEYTLLQLITDYQSLPEKAKKEVQNFLSFQKHMSSL